MGISITGGTPIAGWFIVENPSIRWFGGTPFQETSISKPTNLIYIIHQHPNKTNHFPIFAASKAIKNSRLSPPSQPPGPPWLSASLPPPKAAPLPSALPRAAPRRPRRRRWCLPPSAPGEKIEIAWCEPPSRVNHYKSMFDGFFKFPYLIDKSYQISIWFLWNDNLSHQQCQFSHQKWWCS